MLQTRDEGKGCVGGDTDDNGFYRETPFKWRKAMKRRKMRCKLPMNLQFFADDQSGAGGSGTQTETARNQTDQNASGQNASGQQFQAIDYEKIQQMLNGTLAAKEDTALKAYFKQQGLSQEEAEQAMAAFKAEKARNQPDVGEIRRQAEEAQAAAQKAAIENAAILEAAGMGIESRIIPYILRLADLSQAAGEDGKINNETIKNALNKVLEDVPQLKPQTSKSNGFVQVGASGGQGNNQGSEDELKKAFGLS